MLVRALPGAGKTTLALSDPDTFVDTDAVIATLFGRQVTKETIEMIESDPKARRRFVAAITTALKEGKVVLTNFYPERFGLKTDVHVTYDENEYVAHLRDNGRPEMVKIFGEDELRSWTQFKSGPSAAVLRLPRGVFLSNYRRLFTA